MCSPGRDLQFGTPEQQAAHLRPTLSADRLWCQLFSEPGAGSDLGSLTTRADLDGDHYVVNGQKVWCSGGRYSDWGILMARTDTGAGKHDGVSFFLFPMDLAGVEVRPLRQMTGEAEFDEVFLTDVELPAEHLLGPLHGGWGVGMAVLTNERGHIGTAVIGLERRLEQLAAIAETDSHGHGRGGLEPVARQQLAGLLARGHAYKAMGLRQGAAASTAASLMKLGITELMTTRRCCAAASAAPPVPSTAQGHLACWRHPVGGSPAARARFSATSSANVSSVCRENPNRDRRLNDRDGRVSSRVPSAAESGTQ